MPRPASRNSCTPRGPSCSISPIDRTSARQPGTGSIASTSAPPRPRCETRSAAGSALRDPELYAGGAVDAFPDQVRVAVVAGVLLDHVDVDPAEADVLLHEPAGVGRGSGGALLAGAGDLRPPGGKRVAQGGALGQLEAAVGTARIGPRVVDRRGIASGVRMAGRAASIWIASRAHAGCLPGGYQ